MLHRFGGITWAIVEIASLRIAATRVAGAIFFADIVDADAGRPRTQGLCVHHACLPKNLAYIVVWVDLLAHSGDLGHV